MRQQVAAFAGFMERKLDERDDGPLGKISPDWTKESYGFLMDKLRQKVKELADSFTGDNPQNAAVSALDAVDVGNCAMMLVDKLTGGKLSTLPRRLAELPSVTKPPASDKAPSGHWFRWLLTCRGESAQVMSGRVFAVSDDRAMTAVRDAALSDKVPRPFEITIARIFRVEDEVVQKTAEVTSL